LNLITVCQCDYVNQIYNLDSGIRKNGHHEGKKRLWQEYQKEIATDNFFYVRSCVRQNFFPAAEQIFLRIMREGLDKKVYENPGHTTCSGIGYHCDVVPFNTTMTVIARQFALMTEAGLENLAVS
jgi:heterodisulfide reductase subunit B